DRLPARGATARRRIGGRSTMKRTHAILAAGVLGLGGTLLSTVPAGAMPWGHSDWGTNLPATNCNCAAGEQPATTGPQVQAAASRQVKPAGTHNNTGETGQPQR